MTPRTYASHPPLAPTPRPRPSTDHDRYEGTYDQSDVHHAVREDEHPGIKVHTLALDPTARSLLPLMSGTQSTHQVDNLSQLPHILGKIWAKVSARAGA